MKMKTKLVLVICFEDFDIRIFEYSKDFEASRIFEISNFEKNKKNKIFKQ